MGNIIKVPKSLKDQPLKKGEWAFRRNNNLLIVRYKDKKDIFFSINYSWHENRANAKTRARWISTIKVEVS